MVFGPCSGVQDDLSCELGDRPCPFATAAPSACRSGGFDSLLDCPLRPGGGDAPSPSLVDAIAGGT
jgi:hypothetical protein